MKKPQRGTYRPQDLYRNSERRLGSQCWHWLGAMGADAPRIWTFDHDRGEKRCMAGATAVWNIATGTGTGGRLPYRSCFCRDCVNPEHVAICADKAALGLIMRERGRHSTDAGLQARKVNIAKAHKAAGIVATPDDIVIAVRSMSGTGRAIAKSLGMTEQTVSRIRRNESHRDLLGEPA